MQTVLQICQIVLIVGGFVGLYLKRVKSSALSENSVAQMAVWQQKHATECDEARKATNRILEEIKISNAKLTELTAAHAERIARLERVSDAMVGRLPPYQA